MKPPPHLRRRLQALQDTPVNYDPTTLDLSDPPAGWTVDDRRQPLPTEAPGAPEPEGTFALASRLIRGYEFVDPSLVRGYFDPEAPLRGRTMLLELRALGLVSVHVGVRVCEIFEGELELDGRTVHRFGWGYRTLEGHVERGQMNWQVIKWHDSGETEFRVHSVSRVASIRNPVIWLGFRLLRGHERELFLDGTCRRMREFTERAQGEPSTADSVRRTSADVTTRALAADDPAHEALARELRDDGQP